MPEELRIDYRRDLSGEGFRLAEPLIVRMGELESAWVRTGDERAYEEWRTTVAELQSLVREHYIGDEPGG